MSFDNASDEARRAEQTREAWLIKQYGHAKLDDLLTLPLSRRWDAIWGFIHAADEAPDGGLILLKTNDGKRIVTNVDNRGKPLTIDHNGRRVKRATAVKVLLDHGRQGIGKYFGYNQATGMTQQQYRRYKGQFPDEVAAWGLDGEPVFQTNWVEHVPDPPEGGDAAEE